MLPILRIVPVGGVILAVLIVVMSLGAPDGSPGRMARALLPARGALMPIDEHPEGRQFLVRAALQRASELDRLRDLPSDPIAPPAVSEAPAALPAAVLAPVPAPPAAETSIAPPPDVAHEEQKVAGLPAERGDSDPEDVTGTIGEPKSAATLPIDIGETSSTELPPLPPLPEERPAEIRAPRLKSHNVTKNKKKVTHVVRRAKARVAKRARSRIARAAQPAKQEAPTSIFEGIFSGPASRRNGALPSPSARRGPAPAPAGTQSAGRTDTPTP